MNIIRTVILGLMINYSVNAVAQIAFNTDGSKADSSAILDIKSTSKGMLLPRLTTIQRDSISSPARGLFIYNTDSHVIQSFDGTVWKTYNTVSCAPQQPANIIGITYPDCNQTGVIYSVAEDLRATLYNWLIPSDATITNGQGTASITVDMGTQSGNVSVRTESGCGNSTYKDLAITIGIPAQPGAISGNPYPGCNATYSIDSVNGATSYVWTVPSDATITSGQGTTSITVDFGTNSGNISVYAENTCGTSDSTYLEIITGIPAQPDSIYGSPGVPENSTRVYSIDEVNGATTYHWTVPADATIASGQGTTSITINFGTTSGNVSVRTENSCGESDYKTLAVTIRDFLCGDQYEDSRDNQIYNTVQIGTQCWMANSLNIGTMIESVNNQADNGIIEKYCYNNDTSNCDTYGGLYQWDEMMQYDTIEGVQGICPTGWHLPTDDEWKTLEMYLGMTQAQANLKGWRGNEAGKLKETGTTHWMSPNTGATNSSGFTALPGGYRNFNGTFYNLGFSDCWWLSTKYSNTDAWYRNLGAGGNAINRDNNYKGQGYSVRCLKD